MQGPSLYKYSLEGCFTSMPERGEAKLPAPGPYGTPWHSDPHHCWRLQCLIMGFWWDALGQGNTDAVQVDIAVSGSTRLCGSLQPVQSDSEDGPAGIGARRRAGAATGTGCIPALLHRAWPKGLPTLGLTLLALSPKCQVCRLSWEGSVSRDSRAQAGTSPGFWERGSIGNFPAGTAGLERTTCPLGQTLHGPSPSGSTS